MTIPWTPDDPEARRLLDDRIETFDVDPAAMTLWERLIAWLSKALSLNIDAGGAGNILIQVVLVAAVGVLLFLLVRYFRPAVSPAGDDAAHQLADPTIPAAQYLHNAQQLLGTNQLDAAFLEAYRYLVRIAAQRNLVDVTPATTATTFGGSLGAVFPAYGHAIVEASVEFNRISYGGSVPTRQATEAMIHLAQTVANAPAPAHGSQNDPARLMPR